MRAGVVFGDDGKIVVELSPWRRHAEYGVNGGIGVQPVVARSDGGGDIRLGRQISVNNWIMYA